jgi:hypothetical protein
MVLKVKGQILEVEVAMAMVQHCPSLILDLLLRLFVPAGSSWSLDLVCRRPEHRLSDGWREKRRRIEQKREKATKEVRIGRRRHSWSTAIYVCCDCVFVVGVGVDRFGFRSQSKIE